MYILVSIVFIAELIIALNIIALIIKADRKVREANLYVDVLNPLIEACMQYARCVVRQFSKSFGVVLSFIKRKKEQIFFKFVMMVSIYSILILFKLKTKKVSKIYKLISAMRDVAFELTI